MYSISRNLLKDSLIARKVNENRSLREKMQRQLNFCVYLHKLNSCKHEETTTLTQCVLRNLRIGERAIMPWRCDTAATWRCSRCGIE